MMKTLLLFCLALAACRPVKSSDSETKGLIYNTSTYVKRWPSPQNIPVCWVNPNDASTDIKDAIKTVITSEYHSKTNVRFIGWGTCTAKELESEVIRMNFQRRWDWSLTTEIKEVGGGMSKIGPNKSACSDDGTILGHFCGKGTMNFQIGKTGEFPRISMNYTKAFHMTTSMALHEFGHALGLGHEHTRKDATKCDGYMNDKVDGEGLTFIGKYDPDSIMNYCRNRATAVRLTPGDVATVNFLYPRPLPIDRPRDSFLLYSMQSKRCLVANSTKASIDNCDQANSSQLFNSVFAEDGSFYLKNIKSGKCLDVASQEDNALVTESACQSTMTQRLYFIPLSNNLYQVQFAHNRKCLNLDLVALDLSSKVTAGSCASSSKNQIFFTGKQN